MPPGDRVGCFGRFTATARLPKNRINDTSARRERGRGRSRRHLRRPDRHAGGHAPRTDVDDLLWSTVDVFHRAAERIARELDDNEQEVLPSPGAKIVITGGLDFNGHRLIWPISIRCLRGTRDMVLVRVKSAERRREFRLALGQKPRRAADGLCIRLAKHGRALQAQRGNAADRAEGRDALPRHGHQQQLADQPKKLGIPLWKFGRA
jgi:hypothetical protein